MCRTGAISLLVAATAAAVVCCVPTESGTMEMEAMLFSHPAMCQGQQEGHGFSVPASFCKCYLYYISFLCTPLLSPWCSYWSCSIGAWHDFIFCGKLMRVGIFAFANMSSLKYTDVASFFRHLKCWQVYAVEWREARGRRKTESMSTNTRKVQSHFPASDSCQATFLSIEPIYIKDILWHFACRACPHHATLQIKVSVN